MLMENHSLVKENAMEEKIILLVEDNPDGCLEKYPSE
jgi:hypothetical protein